jgi:hypothetical protein
MTESESALAAAKTHRAEASTALQVAAISASTDLLDVDVCKSHVAAVEQARAAAITAAKPAAAMKADSALLSARISLEIAEARAKASTDKHTAAVAADIAAKAGVTQAARVQIDAEMIDLAAEFSQALDAAFKIGERLQALSLRDNRPTSVGAVSTLPKPVEQALERMPKSDPLHVPVNILRYGASSTAWADRYGALLTTDDEAA